MSRFDYVCLRIYFGLRRVLLRFSELVFNRLDAIIDRRNARRENKRKGRGA